MLVEQQVQARYAEGAKEKQEALCCPVDYQTELLELLPEEIIEKDYGCGDPSRYVKPGDVVLDLGSGGGKVCYMAAQLVGEHGHVHGVDMTDDMLALAHKYKPEMAEKLGGDRVTFHKGYIQNLALDLAQVSDYLEKTSLSSLDALNSFEHWKAKQQQERPMIADGAVSLVISNCVLNLVSRQDRQKLLSEIFRVLKPGGRVAISDIVCDEYVPESLQKNEELWSGCISGAFHEHEFLQAFTDAGFVNACYDKWDAAPWRVVEGIEFRSVTLLATKPPKTDMYDGGHALMYVGPFSSVDDDMGNTFPRGQRIAVSKRTHDFFVNSELASAFVGFSPEEALNLGCFCKPKGTIRPVSDTKGGLNSSSITTPGGSCC